MTIYVSVDFTLRKQKNRHHDWHGHTQQEQHAFKPQLGWCGVSVWSSIHVCMFFFSLSAVVSSHGPKNAKEIR